MCIEWKPGNPSVQVLEPTKLEAMNLQALAALLVGGPLALYSLLKLMTWLASKFRKAISSDRTGHDSEQEVHMAHLSGTAGKNSQAV